VAAAGSKSARAESFIHVEVDRVPDAAALQALAADVARVLEDVRMAVSDWGRMRERVQAIIQGLDEKPPPIPPEELAEGRAFLKWLANNHFTFLGCRSHDLIEVKGQDALRIVPDSSLGILSVEHGKDVASALPHCHPRCAPTRAGPSCWW
jgi:glutamate dehydrogenase